MICLPPDQDRPEPGQRYRIPAASGVGFRLDRGQTLRVIDPFGQQVSDLFCVTRGPEPEALSAGRTIDYADRLYVTTGDVLYGNRSTRLLSIVADDVGRHDLTLPPCSPEMFVALRGDDGTHPSCFENLRRPLSRFGVGPEAITCSFNVFMDVRFAGPVGKMTIGPPASGPGDAIELLALVDLVVGLTACSSEVTNAGSLGPVDFEVR